VKQRAPDSGVYAISAYVGTAHIVRKDLFIRLGSYREIHMHQGEEGDLSLRMLHAGYIVRAGTSEPIRHLESPKRDFTRLFENNARNHILYAWHNIPMPYMLPRMIGMTINLLRWGLKKKYVKASVRGLWRGYRDLLMGRLDPRKPVSKRTYLLSRRLYKTNLLALSDMADLTRGPELAPLGVTTGAAGIATT
jgi:hypothetical protein